MSDTSRIEERIKDLREWLKKEAPECFIDQKRTEEGTQERVYWHHGYMMGLRDALRFFTADHAINPENCIQDKTTGSFSA
ncbi:MAG: hypothetical protein ABSF72_11285 [Candidatus Sulfotelmatobacter sp.]|jgi:hypothetical protein